MTGSCALYAALAPSPARSRQVGLDELDYRSDPTPTRWGCDPRGRTILLYIWLPRNNTSGNPLMAATLVPKRHFGRAGLRLPGGLPSQQDESVGDRAAPAQVIMRTLKFLVKHLVAVGAEYVPEVTIGHQD
jgi:hypothetical protein